MKMSQILIGALLPILGSCVQEVYDIPEIDRQVNIALSVSPHEANTYSPVAPVAGESTIDNVYIWFFPITTSDATASVGFYSKTGLGIDGVLNFTLLFADIGLPASPGVYEVYVLANLPASTVIPPRNATKDNLKKLREKQFVRTLANPMISLSGIGYYATGADLSIQLQRTVARFDLECVSQLPGWSAVDAYVEYESLLAVYLAGLNVYPTERSTSKMLSTGSNTFRAYLYENKAGNKIQVKVAMKNGLLVRYFTSELNSAANGKIDRNKVYTMKLTVNPV